MSNKIDDKMMMYQTETLRTGVTQWKNEALSEHQTRLKRPRAIEKGIRKNGLNRMFKPFFNGRGRRARTLGTRFWRGCCRVQSRIGIGFFKAFIANGTQDRVPFDALLMI